MSTIGQRWSRERAWAWYRQRPIPFGCNFLPSTAVNSTEMWQAASFDVPTIDRELSWAARSGFNSCRVFLPYLVWEEDARTFKARIASFLSIAARHSISTILILFDDCAFAGKEPYAGPQNSPVPGVHNSGWTPSPGPTIADDPAMLPHLELYVKDILATFARDERVLLWDLYNEPGNSARGAGSLSLLEHAFAWAREVNPAQPLSSGVWGCQPTDERCLQLSDILTFHEYNDASALNSTIATLQQYGYPLVCTEWMARTRQSLFETHLPLFVQAEVGCYIWGLVNGKTQTHYPWGWPQNGPEPELWFHDLLRKDGTPYQPQEIETLARYRPAFQSHTVRGQE